MTAACLGLLIWLFLDTGNDNVFSGHERHYQRKLIDRERVTIIYTKVSRLPLYAQLQRHGFCWSRIKIPQLNSRFEIEIELSLNQQVRGQFSVRN